MTTVRLLGKVARLPFVVGDGWRYPLLRLQARTGQTPLEALAALGFDRVGLHGYERAFDAVAPALYAELSEAAAAAGGAEAREAVRRLDAVTASSREGKKLLYLTVRALRPELVVETGTFSGTSSAFLLRALEDNGCGRLITFDVPNAVDSVGVCLPAGCAPGWLIPPALRGRLELVLGDIRLTLRRRLDREQPVDVFFHDSQHTTRQMLYEYGVAWRRLSRGGALISDDVFWNPAFWAFTRRHRAPFRHIGTVGVTRKP